MSGEKRMTPSRFQDPLRPFATSHTGSGGAPEMSTFWSLPSAKNARNRLSGDQNGKVAPCVPGIGFAPSSPVRPQPQEGLAVGILRGERDEAAVRRHRERAAAGVGQVELGLLGRQHEGPDAHRGTRAPGAGNRTSRARRATIAAAATAQASFSRFLRRATTGAGSPAWEPPSATHWSWSFASCAVWKRSSGSLARHVLTTRFSAGGIIGEISEIAGGSSRRIAPMSEAWLVPEKAFLPVAISYSRAPNEKMSLRASASLPSSCSGAMYWNVPRTVPRSVSGWLACISVASRETPDETSRPRRLELRQAEVEELHPRLRQHDVAGLQVPVHDPLPVRLVERVGDLDPVTQELLGRERPLAQAVRQRLALEVLHDEVLGLALAVDVVERADVRMRDLRDRLGLALEPLAQLRVRREVRRQDLDGDRALEPRVPRLVNLPHPAGPDGRKDLVRTEFGSGGQRHMEFLGRRSKNDVPSLVGLAREAGR